MAYEHVLKMLVGGLENTASDFEKLARLLNLRVQFRGMNKRFIPAEYRPPGPRYPKKEESASKAAASASTIANAYASAVKYFGAEPCSPAGLEADNFDESGLLHLIASWQGLRAGVLKAILGTYGELAAGQPFALLPGPASELRLWAEVAAWFEKLAKDGASFLAIQRLPSAPVSGAATKRPTTILESLLLIEQSVHQATLDALLIAGALPYHLYRTAQRGASRSRTS
jgi:hypothetical protein